MEQKTIEEMIANGEIGTMTECAYGSAIAETEKENTVKKNKKTQDKKTEDNNR